MPEIYGILNYMTGDNLSTIGLLSASKPCKAALLEQHPQLAGVDGSVITRENRRSWYDAQVAQFGSELPVSPLAGWEKRSIADDILDVNRINPSVEIMVIEP